MWPLLAVVDAAPDGWCAPLEALRAGGDGRRLAAAAHLADLFDTYAAHRPELLAAWRDGDDADVPDDLAWQPELWRRLRARIAGPDPAERLGAAVAALERDPDAADLPPRLSLFGPTRLPAAHLAVLAALARHRDVHVWLPHPSPALWARVTEHLRQGERSATPRRQRPHPGAAPPSPARARSAAMSASCRFAWSPCSTPWGSMPTSATTPRPVTPRQRCCSDSSGICATTTPPAGDHVLAPTTGRYASTPATVRIGRSRYCARSCSACWRTTRRWSPATCWCCARTSTPSRR